MERTDEAVIEELKAAVAALNKALEAAALQAIEVEPNFIEATAMEHPAECLVLNLKMTKQLGVI